MRLFFLLTGASAVLLTVLWAAMLAGAVPTPRLPGGPIAWHAHELIFGFVLASVIGFLPTAVPEFNGTREAPPALTVQLVRAPHGGTPGPDSDWRWLGQGLDPLNKNNYHSR